jgi:hypothetical protein
MTTTRGAEEEARARTRRARPGHMWASGSAPPPPAASAECSWPDTFSAGRQQAAGTQAGRQQCSTAAFSVCTCLRPDARLLRP